jgi:PPP family 3-phenylpropionic acid transporter
LLLGVMVEFATRDVIPWVLWLSLALSIAVVFALRRERWLGEGAQRFNLSLLTPLFSRRDLRALYLAAFMSRLTQHGLYGFLPLHLERLGVSDWWVPAYWSVGVLSEIALIRNTPRLFGRLGTRTTLLVAASLSVVQFGLMALLLDPWLLLAVMPLHGVTFGVWYVASMEHLGRTVKPASRGVAQACFQISAFGLGGTISAVSAGYLYAAGQGELMFGTAALASVAVVAVVAMTFPREMGRVAD